MASRNQVNLSLSDETAAKLDMAISKAYPEGNQPKGRASVIVEILETYLPFWEEIQQSKLHALNAQKEMLGKAPAVDLLSPTTRRKKA